MVNFTDTSDNEVIDDDGAPANANGLKNFERISMPQDVELVEASKQNEQQSSRPRIPVVGSLIDLIFAVSITHSII